MTDPFPCQGGFCSLMPSRPALIPVFSREQVARIEQVGVRANFEMARRKSKQTITCGKLRLLAEVTFLLLDHYHSKICSCYDLF